MGKDLITLNECANVLGLSRSYLYKLTSTNQIPFYKPMGKKIFFSLKEVEDWAKRGRVMAQ